MTALAYIALGFLAGIFALSAVLLFRRDAQRRRPRGTCPCGCGAPHA